MSKPAQTGALSLEENEQNAVLDADPGGGIDVPPDISNNPVVTDEASPPLLVAPVSALETIPADNETEDKALIPERVPSPVTYKMIDDNPPDEVFVLFSDSEDVRSAAGSDDLTNDPDRPANRHFPLLPANLPAPPPGIPALPAPILPIIPEAEAPVPQPQPIQPRVDPLPVLDRLMIPVPDVALTTFNVDNGPMKRFMDIMVGARRQIPTVLEIKNMLNTLIRTIKYNHADHTVGLTHNLRCDLVTNTEFLRFSCHSNACRRLVHSLQHNPTNRTHMAKKLNIGKNLRDLWITMGGEASHLLTAIGNFPDGANLLNVPALIENNVPIQLETFFRRILAVLDETYSRGLLGLADYSDFTRHHVSLDGYPSLSELVRDIPESKMRNQRPHQHVNVRIEDVPNDVTLVEQLDNKNFIICRTSELISNCPVMRNHMVNELYHFVRNNPGKPFEFRAPTGGGKTLAVSTLMCALGTVGMAQHNDLHMEQTYRTLCELEVDCEIITLEYAKFGRFEGEHRDRLIHNARAHWLPQDRENRPAQRGYQKMRDRPRKLFLFTYQTLNCLIRNADFPDILLMDDVRTSNTEKDKAMFGLMHDHSHCPPHMTIGGLSATALDTGRFNFERLADTRGGLQLFSPPGDTPFPVTSFDDKSWLMFSSTADVLEKIVRSRAECRQQLLDAQRADLLPVIETQRYIDLFTDYGVRRRTLGISEFGTWVKEHFTIPPGLLPALRVLRVQPTVEVPITEHTRLINVDHINDCIFTYLDMVQNQPGAAIVFLPSDQAVVTISRLLNPDKGFQLLPITGPDSNNEIQQALDPLIQTGDGVRGRVILLSPTAEASLTFPYVTTVIDSGLKQIKLVSNDTGLQFTLTVATNQQEVGQRRGRTGRMCPGIYLPVPSREPPDVYPRQFLESADYYKVEMRTVIMYMLLLMESRGAAFDRREILDRLTDWFQDMENHILESALRLMEIDGIIASNPGGEIYLTPLGRLVSCFPGSYDENFMVAMGFMFGTFRSMVGYVCGRFALDEIWGGTMNPRRASWWRFFNYSTALDNESHIDYVLSVLYWYLKSEYPAYACYRADIRPAMLQAVRTEMRFYEACLYAYMVEMNILGHAMPTYNDNDILVRRMTLFAGTHGNVALTDGRRGHALLFPSGQTLKRSHHSDDACTAAGSCAFDEVEEFMAFTKARSGAGNADQVFGESSCGVFIPVLFLDSARPALQDQLHDTHSFILRGCLDVHGSIVPEVLKIRDGISGMISAWLASSKGTHKELCLYLKRISKFMRQHIRENTLPDYAHWIQKDVIDCIQFPPAGMFHRRRWCPRCLHQGHIRAECLAGFAEINRRFNMAAEVLEKANLETPVQRRLSDVYNNRFNITVDRYTGRRRCCMNCDNVLHSNKSCRGYIRADGCIRCGEQGHLPSHCPAPLDCANCHVTIHHKTRCFEDRLFIAQTYHISVANYIMRILRVNSPTDHWDGGIALNMLNAPPVTDDYYLKPRNSNNPHNADGRAECSGFDRHPFEEAAKDFI